MTVIKGHICPSCAGALSIDIDKQMYICPFCGVTFDYEYFNEDNVLDLGSDVFSNDRFSGYKKKKEDASVIAISAMKKEELANKNTELKKQADALKRDFIKKSTVLVEYKSQ